MKKNENLIEEHNQRGEENSSRRRFIGQMLTGLAAGALLAGDGKVFGQQTEPRQPPPTRVGDWGVRPYPSPSEAAPTAPAKMKIRDIKVDLLRGTRGGSFTLVRVETDAGITGYGEASRQAGAAVKRLIETEFKPLLVGQNPLQIEAIHDFMRIRTYKWEGRLNSFAISGIDIALWDILGKALNVPVYQLLGGAVRDRIPVYASLDRDTAANQAKVCAAAVEAGFPGVKIQTATRYGFDLQPDDTLTNVKAVRAAIGDRATLIIDPNMGWTTQYAIQMAKKLEPYNIQHMEQPIPERDIDALIEFKKESPIAVGWGEEDWDFWMFRSVLQRDGADVIQPDPVKCGGLTTCKKISVLADAFSKPVVCHSTGTGLGFAALLHFAASTPIARLPQESVLLPAEAIKGTQNSGRLNSVNTQLLKNPFRVVDGHIAVPHGPGLGVEIDEQKVAEWRVG